MRKIHIWPIGLLLAVAVVSPAQVKFTEFPVPTAGSAPFAITAGPDGNVWFAEYSGSKIGKITPAGVITEYSVPTGAIGITAGPDGNLWFTEGFGNNAIGRITPSGVITVFPIPGGAGTWITAGPDGNLWFTQQGAPNQIGSITPAGVITEFPAPAGRRPYGITAGPDGNLWFTEYTGNNIGRITPAGVITEFPIPTASSFPTRITAGPDGNVWFGEEAGNVGRITPGGVISEFPAGNTITDITTGPDGNLWFVEPIGAIGQITPAGVITEFLIPSGNSSQPNEIAAGPDGNLWFTEYVGNKIGRIQIQAACGTSQISISSLSLDHGGNSGQLTSQIYGCGFQNGAAVKLTGLSPAIIGSNVNVLDSSAITATFTLTGAMPGVWNLVVTNPDGTTAMLTSGFTIEQGGAPQISVNIVGRDQIRFGTEQTYYLVLNNTGNLDASSLAASVGTSAPISVQVPDIDALADNYQSGTVGQVDTFLIPSLPAGSTQSIPFALTAPSNATSFGIRAQHQVLSGLASGVGTASATGSNGTGNPLGGLLFGPPLFDGCSQPLQGCVACDSSWQAYKAQLALATNAQTASHEADLAFDYEALKVTSDIAEGGLAIYAIARIAPQFLGAIGLANDAASVQVVSSLLGYGHDAFKGILVNDPNSGFTATSNLVLGIAQFKAVYNTTFAPLLNSAAQRALATQFLAALGQVENIASSLSSEWKTLTGLWAERNASRSIFAGANASLCSVVSSYQQCLNSSCGGGKSLPPDTGTDDTDLNGPTVTSLDPNDKVGSAGAGPLRYVSGGAALPYSVFFENQASATAPAQSVTITDTLDANLDLSTLMLGPIAFPNQVMNPPAIPLSVAPFTTTVDLRPTTNLLVKINASLNTTTSVLTWTFQSLDPATGLPPTDPLTGFLPPGAQGNVFFTVAPKTGVTTGTAIQNTATVVFDVNPPINTPTWFNTIDNTKPISKVSPLPSAETAYSFNVQWSGTDIGSGIQDFTVYVSDNGGPFTPWLTNTAATQGFYNGVGGHTYGFYSVARDLVGNVETGKTSAEATTHVVVDTTPPVIVPQINGNLGNNGWYRGSVTVSWSTTDPESGIASSSGCNTSTLTADMAGVTLTCSATNGAGLTASAPVTIKIDQTPPVISGMPAPICALWPPNGKMIQVATVTAADLLSKVAPGSFQVSGTSNEPPSAPEIAITPNGSGGYVVQLQAARLGNGSGRVYTLTATASDLAGNSSTVTATCTVPHDQGK